MSEESGASRAARIDGQPADRRSDGAGRSPAVGIDRTGAVRRAATAGRSPARALALLVLAAAPAAAHAGTVAGTIRSQSTSAAIPGAEVRAWEVGTKGATLRQTVTSDGSGNYLLTLAAGTYKIDCRGPDDGSNWGDRWYDQVAPAGAGYVAEAADELVVTASSSATAVDIYLEVLGGIDGRVLFGANPLPGPVVRMERRADPRIHHNDFADAAPQAGVASFRGLPPANDYQMIVYDPSGARDTLLVAGPFTVTAGSNGSYGDRPMAAAPADPYEGNDSPSCAATLVDETLLHAAPPQPWATAGARIGAIGTDVDWFCFQAVKGDRLLLTASTAFQFGGTTRYHPWTDPLLSFWTGQGAVKLAEDDDGGGGYYDSFVDTGPLAAGCYCAAVTTFGDPDYNGSGQQSTGAYGLTWQMGNRPPALRVRKGGSDVPEAPLTLSLQEGQTLDLTLLYDDLEGDPVTPSFSHRDSSNADVTTGTLNLGATSGDYTWVAGATAAQQSPYTIAVTAADAEFTASHTVLLVVTAVNDPPTAPTLISPIDGSVSTSPSPVLTIGNASDPDADALTYDLELYYGDTGGTPAQAAGDLAEGSPQTSWMTAPIAENTRVYWRARARDGSGGISPWTDFEDFLVDSTNDPPDAPVLIKPGDGEVVMMRRPGLSAINPADPEDEDLTLHFQIAGTADFAIITWSADVPASTTSATTMVSLDQDLDWGAEYHARVRAEDARGGFSEWSNVRRFRLKDNLPPGAPGLEDTCRTETYTPEPPSQLTVVNPVDPENEAVTLELEIHFLADDPDAVEPLISAAVPMDTTTATTTIPFDGSGLGDGNYRWRVRASDGALTSEWTGCDFIVLLPLDESGGCCRAGGPGDALPLALLVLLIVSRRRSSRP